MIAVRQQASMKDVQASVLMQVRGVSAQYCSMMTKQEQKSQEASAAAFKANETSGAEERSRKAKMANCTRTHGKDDDNNPFSFQNYTAAEQVTVRAAIADRSSKETATTEAVKPTSSAIVPKRNHKAGDYPTNWKEIGVEIRSRRQNVRGHEQCECCGERRNMLAAVKKSIASDPSIEEAKGTSKSALR
jgi:hypothetical protein